MIPTYDQYCFEKEQNLVKHIGDGRLMIVGKTDNLVVDIVITLQQVRPQELSQGDWTGS